MREKEKKLVGKKIKSTDRNHNVYVKSKKIVVNTFGLTKKTRAKDVNVCR